MKMSVFTMCLASMLLLVILCSAHVSGSNATNVNLTRYTDSSLNMYFKSLLSRNDTITKLKDDLGLLHCNVYCFGSKVNRHVCEYFSPPCRPCQCDEECDNYGDCCPDVNGHVDMKRQTTYQCVSSGITTYRDGGYFMITSCPNRNGLSSAGKILADDIAPVTSVNSNITYLNEDIAACHGDHNYKRWTRKSICPMENRTDSMKENEELKLDECSVYIFPSYGLPVRDCNPAFTNLEYIDTCNVTGLWDGSTYDIDADVQCEEWQYYPITEGKYVFKNIYCFLCNGYIPSVRIGSATVIRSMVSIHTLITFNVDNEKPECKKNEWYDQIKNVCRQMNCRHGYDLKGEECVLTPYKLPDVQYELEVDLWPSEMNQSYSGIEDSEDIESMVVQNMPNVLATFNLSFYVFTVKHFSHFERNTSEPLPSFRIELMFWTDQRCCRAEFEQHLPRLFKDPWIFHFNDVQYLFGLSEKNIDAFVHAESQPYKMTSPGRIPEITDPTIFIFFRSLQNVEYVHLPFQYPPCSYVHLRGDDFIWNKDKSISLRFVDITIQPRSFTKDNDHAVVVCVDTLKEVYKTYLAPQESIKRAENIVSLFFSILSLICLALTFITYCTFPSLLTLPTKNTMCLVVSLFVAQLLLQFGGLEARDETTCKVIGVLIHYFWLSVIFWMNVCSYHMFHVFYMDAAKPISIKSHRSHLLRYFAYANGLSLVIVVITICANLGVSSGNKIGYGNGNCYLSTALLTGVCFVLPLGLILIMNITFFGISVWTIAKISKMSALVGSEKSQVHIYMKLSTLTGIFWTLSILAVNLHVQALVFISVILNASQGVFIFISYVANRRVYDLWKKKLVKSDEIQDSQQNTETTRMKLNSRV